MPIYCTSCKKQWIIASTKFSYGKCPYCGAITRPLPPLIIIPKRSKEEIEDQ